jgi:ATP-dependent helicase/nuclease subunit A
MHNKVNSVSEEMRLLYVALTRAKEQLFITLADNDYTRSRAAGFAQDIEAEGGITPFCAANALSMQDWLIMALLVHPDGEPVREMAECDYMTSAVTDTKLKFSLYEEKQTKSNSQQENVKALPDMKMLEQLKKNFSFKYDGRLSQLPAKLTVTEIAKKEQDDENKS